MVSRVIPEDLILLISFIVVVERLFAEIDILDPIVKHIVVIRAAEIVVVIRMLLSERILHLVLVGDGLSDIQDWRAL